MPAELAVESEHLLGLSPFDELLPSLEELVADDLADVDALVDLLGRAVDSGLSPAELVSGRSRLPRVRPILVALAARAAGSTVAVDLETQHAAELLHLALVVHDLALGQRGGRRRRVARRIVRRSVEWLGGNQLTLRALELSRHASRPEILGELVDTMREIADGQSLSRDLQAGGMPTLDDWTEHADMHTGAVLAFCCRAGAWLADGDPVVRSALGRYGRHVGRAWHVAEDLVQLGQDDGARHLLARAVGGRPMLPVVEAIGSDVAYARHFERLLARPRLAEAEALVAPTLGLGRAGAKAVVAQETWKARRALNALHASPYRHGLERFAAGLAKAV